MSIFRRNLLIGTAKTEPIAIIAFNGSSHTSLDSSYGKVTSLFSSTYSNTTGSIYDVKGNVIGQGTLYYKGNHKLAPIYATKSESCIYSDIINYTMACSSPNIDTAVITLSGLENGNYKIGIVWSNTADGSYPIDTTKLLYIINGVSNNLQYDPNTATEANQYSAAVTDGTISIELKSTYYYSRPCVQLIILQKI